MPIYFAKAVTQCEFWSRDWRSAGFTNSENHNSRSFAKWSYRCYLLCGDVPFYLCGHCFSTYRQCIYTLISHNPLVLKVLVTRLAKKIVILMQKNTASTSPHSLFNVFFPLFVVVLTLATVLQPHHGSCAARKVTFLLRKNTSRLLALKTKPAPCAQPVEHLWTFTLWSELVPTRRLISFLPLHINANSLDSPWSCVCRQRQRFWLVLQLMETVGCFDTEW